MARHPKMAIFSKRQGAVSLESLMEDEDASECDESQEEEEEEREREEEVVEPLDALEEAPEGGGNQDGDPHPLADPPASPASRAPAKIRSSPPSRPGLSLNYRRQ